ncbi:hypothetical protein MSAN_00091600 [Mycena sanguinolenta]|uniref:F-box domain-containing protein n=1 Tax=Mycena sanguinolenta TaxID=230812 RepID=A0A8H6ZCY1_9AGAR|nr:hypothetical protein MSAN_00091600 [Mycena sanguinolenta]
MKKLKISAWTLSRVQKSLLVSTNASASCLRSERKSKLILTHKKALISHPRRLPADIVQEIFIACLPTTRNAVMSTQEAPLLLCRICSAWRRIALSAPRLWASLHVPFDFVLQNESRISAVAQWLQRSAACPISISVCQDEWNRWAGDAEDVSSSIGMDALTRSLCAVAGRWRHVKFDDISFATAQSLREIESPLLESVEFIGGIPALKTLEFLRVPSLRTVTLRFQDPEPLDGFFLAIPLIWDQLQHLTITSVTGISISNLIDVLGRCPQLISIHLTPIVDAVLDSFPAESILPFLASFTIPPEFSSRFVAPRSLTHLISYVSMPELRQFNVQAATCQYDAQTSFFLVNLGRKSPLVADLTIYLPSLTAQSLPESLQQLLFLTRLVVFDSDNWAWDNGGFQSCAVTLLLTVLSHTSACPMLQELVIHDCISLDSKSTLDGFIRQRMECVHRLRRLDILFGRSWTELQVLNLMSETEIQSYLVQGLEISFRCQNNTPWAFIPPGPWTGLSSEDV